ncbi:MAG: hypothetical protein HY926_01025 [Elusimicrobia bacterium]|nr:hypothetical protein [Elusimicrobiota bacterium]
MPLLLRLSRPFALVCLAATLPFGAAAAERLRRTDGTPVEWLPLDCKDSGSIRELKWALVLRGWRHALAEELARCACGKRAGAAGWPEPRPRLPEKSARAPEPAPCAWDQTVPECVESMSHNMRGLGLPLSKDQTDGIASCWLTRHHDAPPPRQPRVPLDCAKPDTIRAFKDIVLGEITDKRAVADDWAHAVCGKTADGAGYNSPAPPSPKVWPRLRCHPGLGDDFASCSAWFQERFPIGSEQARRLAEWELKD